MKQICLKQKENEHNAMKDGPQSLHSAYKQCTKNIHGGFGGIEAGLFDFNYKLA